MSLEQPKRPVGGAYGIFLTEKRPEYTKACEGQKAVAISAMAGKAWKELSDTEKKPYEEKYIIAKAKFEKDMEAFLEAGGEKSKGAAAMRTEKRNAKEGKKAKTSDPNKPKAPAGGGYGVFMAENRAKIAESLPKDHKMTDVAKEAGAQWKALSEAAKQPYEATYAKKRQEYLEAMKDYTPPEPEMADVVEKVEKVEKTTPSKKRAKPDTATPTPAAKATRGAAKKASSSKEVEIDAAVLKEAEGLKLVSQIKNLLSRPDVASSGKSQKEMLDALKTSDGLVNKAKLALLGA
jgi:hypothetical protein